MKLLEHIMRKIGLENVILISRVEGKKIFEHNLRNGLVYTLCRTEIIWQKYKVLLEQQRTGYCGEI